MPDSMLLTPDIVVAVGDPGDETASRYRFQWTYAAIVCCMLLDETENVAEVFCEHHEDVLIKFADNTYAGLQIKTRGLDQDVWKATDGAIVSTCVRFAKIEAEFPRQFRVFRFLTNHPIYAARNGKDFRFILESIRSANSIAQLSGPVSKFLASVARQANVSLEVGFTALSKTHADDSLPKLQDAEMRLVTQLTEVWDRATEYPLRSVRRAANHLVWECTQASSLAHRDVLPAYLAVATDAANSEQAARLAGKCINRTRLLAILDEGLNETALLVSPPGTFAEPGSGSKDLLIKKLDAGGFSAVSLNSATDLRDKAEYLGIVWTQKHGREPGLQRYGHVQSLVLSDAARAFEATKNESRPFGSDMLSQLHSRFQQRRTDGSQLYDCSNEHLEGFAYCLTALCKVQWSLDRPWEKE